MKTNKNTHFLWTLTLKGKFLMTTVDLDVELQRYGLWIKDAGSPGDSKANMSAFSRLYGPRWTIIIFAKNKKGVSTAKWHGCTPTCVIVIDSLFVCAVDVQCNGQLCTGTSGAIAVELLKRISCSAIVALSDF